jgi:hypothetical protein
LVPQLEEFGGKNVLESLKFDIMMERKTPTTDPAKWEKLDNILSKSGAFPFLRRVEIRVDLWDRHYIYGDDELEDIVEELKALEANNFLWLGGHDSLVFIFEVKFSR